MRVIIFLSMFVVMGLSAKSAEAQYYGAIAISPAGTIGWSYDYRSRYAAERAARIACAKLGYRGCKTAIWFRNACGAIAVIRHNSWGASWGYNRHQAQRKALRICNRNYGGCWVKRWACTTRY